MMSPEAEEIIHAAMVTMRGAPRSREECLACRLVDMSRNPALSAELGGHDGVVREALKRMLSENSR